MTEKKTSVSTVALKTKETAYQELAKRSAPAQRRFTVGALAGESLARYFWLLAEGRRELAGNLSPEEIEMLGQFLKVETDLSELSNLWTYFDTINADLARRLRTLSLNALVSLLDLVEIKARHSERYPSFTALLADFPPPKTF
jgi:hypothetical protein